MVTACCSLAPLRSARSSYHCAANSAATSSYPWTKPSKMSFAASRFSATVAPSWARHQASTAASTSDAALSPIFATARL